MALKALSYLWIDRLKSRLFFIHLEVEFGGSDGQGAFHHHGRGDQLRTGAQVYWACETDANSGRSENTHKSFSLTLSSPYVCKKNISKGTSV